MATLIPPTPGTSAVLGVSSPNVSRDAAMRKLKEMQGMVFHILRDLEDIHPVTSETEVYRQIKSIGQSLPDIMMRLARMRIST